MLASKPAYRLSSGSVKFRLRLDYTTLVCGSAGRTNNFIILLPIQPCSNPDSSHCARHGQAASCKLQAELLEALILLPRIHELRRGRHGSVGRERPVGRRMRVLEQGHVCGSISNTHGRIHRLLYTRVGKTVGRWSRRIITAALHTWMLSWFGSRRSRILRFDHARVRDSSPARERGQTTAIENGRRKTLFQQ